jgi:hypothetical protein
MRTVLILAVLAVTAKIFDLKWLGGLIALFLLGCALFGVGEFLHDCCDGYGFSIRGQMRRASSRRTPEEDEAIVQDFKRWKQCRASRRAL